jgi:nicotinamide-nucleotide amidase
MSDVRRAHIIAVGSELLTAHKLDTNSLFLAGRLEEIGIELHGKSVIGDDMDALRREIDDARTRADLVILTGGLGPTSDDLTREATADVLRLPLAEDPTIVSAISDRFRSRGMKMPEANRRQAMVPHGAEVLANPRGTAPGLWIEHDHGLFVLLPGPPRELQPMFDDHVRSRLAARTAGRRVRRRVVKVTGRSESMVEEIAYPIYSKVAGAAVPIATTILASPGQIELHLSASGTGVEAMDAALDDAVRQLAAALGASAFSIDGRSLEQVVGDLLHDSGRRIAVAESCTGGLLLGRLTDVAGSSGWVTGGVVAYSNDVKTNELSVPMNVLAEHGAVSERVATLMADNVRVRLGADIGVGVTGIAGPGGGSPEKPVGTVVIAVAGLRAEVRTFRFVGDRQMVRTQSVNAALDMVRRQLLS